MATLREILKRCCLKTKIRQEDADKLHKELIKEIKKELLYGDSVLINGIGVLDIKFQKIRGNVRMNPNFKKGAKRAYLKFQVSRQFRDIVSKKKVADENNPEI